MGRVGTQQRRRRLSGAAGVPVLVFLLLACGGKRPVNGDGAAGSAGNSTGAGTAGSSGAGLGGAGSQMAAAGAGGAGMAGRTGVAGGGGVPPWADPPDGGVACKNLECRQSTCKYGQCIQWPCPPGTFTTLTGKVFDPAGKVPLYNVNVFVPNIQAEPLTDGPGCDKCGAALVGEPVVQTKTAADGSFTLGEALADVPSGLNVPLVIQVGKWRREVTIPNVIACTDNPITDANITRLPRNHSEGHMPRIAVTTGGADALECLLRKIGIADSEFTPESAAGRVNLFAGTMGTNAFAPALGGAAFTPVEPWWDNVQNLMKYDIVLHSCDGIENATNKSAAAMQALKDFADVGGRVFASHWHGDWLQKGPPPWPGIAVFNHQLDLPHEHPVKIDTSFEKGKALADWLEKVGGSSMYAGLIIRGGKHTIDSVGTARRWIYSEDPASVQYLEALTPIGGAACGRVVLSDIHVTSGLGFGDGDSSSPSKPFPTGCITTDLTAHEKALVFMLFDLSSCT
jgi:hypothetical protein